MLFRRRNPATWRDRVRAILWPRKGIDRPFRYYGKRILRLSASPHAVAVGVAAGTLSAFTPFLGLHVVLAVALAHVLAGNIIAAALSTAIANPLTLPLIWAGTLEVGESLLGAPSEHSGRALDLAGLYDHLTFSDLWGPVLEPMLVGSFALGLPAAAVAYAGTRVGVNMFRRQRLQRVLRRGRPENPPPPV
ncbi:uncharacterized protein (DUF2062 family) [Mycoplana sp. BE70]|uniref:DUF2062 domain-containing protein n=1 Tax=Mycoplana sp. BE70 TaxID=2817775 RepID=UPI00285B1F03|nr:DUF2062 domain-containing protein [Mycoplana sp. BE70]MDR6757296.1 uncharacterized protein (DUF2062 family) [Mycoplana sp. BE70]